MVNYQLNEQILSDNDFVTKVAEIFKAAHPLNVFLNYTVDEVA
jgi:hypothetical protein